MTQWFAQETFWRQLFPFFFGRERLEAAAAEIDKVLSVTGLDAQGGTAVLDMCCGPGRHSVELARCGCKVTAVDRSSFLLGKARDFGAASGVEVEWLQQDMRDFVRPGAYRLALNMFSSFGYFQERDDDRRVLRQLYESLESGGTLMIELLGKEVFARNYQPTRSYELADGSVLVERVAVFDGWSRVETDWLLLRDQKVESFRMSLTLYSGRELEHLLRAVGFTKVRLLGDLDASDYGPRASRLVVIARKAP